LPRFQPCFAHSAKWALTVMVPHWRAIFRVLTKDIFDLTDEQALEQLEWSTAWHHALDVLPEEAHACQKTLHN